MASHLLALLETDSSRIIADMTVQKIGTNPDRFEEVLHYAVDGQYPINMRAARVVELSLRNNKSWYRLYVSYFIEILSKHTNDGVKRAFLKAVEYSYPKHISDDELGHVISICFDKLNGLESVAVKAYSIDILQKILSNVPDLKHEFIETLENQLGMNTLALDRKIKKVLKSIDV